MISPADRLIGIVDLQQIRTRNERINHVVTRALSAGMTTFLLRAKDLPAEVVDAVDWSALIDRLDGAGARVILHDSLLFSRPELSGRSMFQHWSAATLKAHIDREALLSNGIASTGITSERAQIAPPECSKNATFGVSAHHAEALLAAETHGAAWAFVSPFASTASKPGYGPVLGVTGTRALCEKTTLPVFALAGIDANTVPDAVKSGVSGVVVMGMLTNADAVLEINTLLKQMETEAWARQTPW